MGRAPCCDKANVKKGPWSPEEDDKLRSYIEKHGTGGNWIALPQKIGLKRCGKSCRLRWLNYLRPNIKHGGFSEEEDNIICNLYVSIGSRWSIIAAQLPGRTDNDIKNYWNTRLKKKLLGKQRKEQQARRGVNGLKQEMKRSVINNPLMVSSSDNNNNNNNINNQNHYWPELPFLSHPIIPYSNQETRFNDHASIRKLLIKLGGRFSNDEDQTVQIQNLTNPQLPNQIPYTQQLYDQTVNISSSAPVDNANAQFTQPQYNNIDWSSGLQMLQGQSNFNGGGGQEIIDIKNSSNSSQRLDGLEFLLGDDHLLMNDRSLIGCSLGEMSSLIYPSVNAPNCEGIQQKFLQECATFDELRYRTGSL